MTALSELIAGLISFLFSLFGGVDLSPIANAIKTLTPYLQAALYILPAGTIASIFNVIVMLWSVRLIIKTLKVIWDILPMV